MQGFRGRGGAALFGVLLGLIVVACSSAMQTAKTAKDIANAACRDSLLSEAQAQGISVAELCDRTEVLRRFMDAVLGAKAEVVNGPYGLKPPAPASQ